jgi:poly-gamma-glutamate synthesis protein (capsule biosynthesis protein)
LLTIVVGAAVVVAAQYHARPVLAQQRISTVATGVDAGAGSQPATRPATRTVTIAATGDVLIHRAVVSTVNAHAAEGGLRWCLAAMEPLLRSADVTFVNLESPLTERFHPPANATPPVLGAPTSYGHALVASGFLVFSLANNHSYDQAGDGLAITLDALEAERAVAVGAGRSEQAARAFAVVDKQGVRVAFVAATDRLNNGSSPNTAGMRVFLANQPNQPALQSALQQARSQADVVVLSMHWSHDFVLAPTPEQRQLAQQWIAWGADVIAGTGPHILQSVQRVASPRGEAVVAYSLGNLLSNQGYRHRVGRAVTAVELRSALDNPMTRDVILLRLGVELSATHRVRFSTLQADAFWTENHVGADDIHLVRLRSVSPALMQERRAAISSALGRDVTIND